MRAFPFARPAAPPPATAVTFLGCIRPDHVHLIATDAAGRPVATATMDDKTLRVFHRLGACIAPAAGLSPMVVTIELPLLGCEAKSTSKPIRQAHAVMLSAAKALFFIEFLDADGVAFARATFDADGFARLIGDECELLEIGAEGGLAIEPAAGAA